MKKTALALVLVCAGLAAAAALAAPPPGKGKHSASTTTGTTTTVAKGKKPPKTGANCKPKISLVLKGTLAADGAAAPATLSVTVKGGNKAARAYKAAAQPIAVAITDKTRISRRGKHDPALLATGDRVVVRARVCKADLAGGATPDLTAARVVANPPKASGTTTTTDTTDSSGG